MTQSDLQYALERLTSLGQAEKTKLPLRLGQSISAPVVNSLNISRTKNIGSTATEVTLTWLDPEDYREFVSTLRVYMFDATNTTPVVVAEPTRSPCRVTVPSRGTARKVTFLVQTALHNGQVSELDLSPGTSVAVQ